MADLEREIEAVKNETIETRNQVIKSTNQVTKLEADVKSFDKKLSAIQSKNQLFLLIGFGIILLVVCAAAYWVANAQTKAAKDKLDETIAQMEKLNSQLSANQDELARFKAAAQRDKTSRENAEQLAIEVMKLIDTQKAPQAITKIRENNLFSTQNILGPIAAKVFDEKLLNFRKEQSEILLKNGRTAYEQKIYPKAIQQLEVAQALATVPAIQENSLYLLAVSYANNADKALAMQTLEDFVRRFPKSQMADDALYHLGSFCEQWDNEECARKAWQKLVDSYPSTPAANVARRKLAK